jgi:predicted amidophosphoribosyltransferase
MPYALTAVDDLTRPDHYFLSADDECHFILEYTAGQGYQYSSTNQFVFNFKKTMDQRGRFGWHYKGEAIQKAARLLAEVLNPKWLERATLVPIPPSKSKDDPLYDDRMTQVLRLVSEQIGGDLKELIVVRDSSVAVHTTVSRSSPDQLEQNYQLVGKLADYPAQCRVGVFDDILTTGAHFRAVKNTILRKYPEAEIVGIFLARRVFANGAGGAY